MGILDVPPLGKGDMLARTSRERAAAILGSTAPTWFSDGRVGLFSHYIFAGGANSTTVRRDGTKPSTPEQLAAEFDAPKFAAGAAAFGVEYVIFTAWHFAMNALYPSTAMTALLPGHATTSTDAIRNLINALKPYGIKVALYVHPLDGSDLTAGEQTATGWNDSTNNYAIWQNFINSVITELGERYGADLDGIWVDMLQDPAMLTKFTDLPRLRNSLLAGNPGRVLMGNSGTNDDTAPSFRSNVVDYLTREYITKPASLNDWVAGYSHVAAIPLTTNSWWAVTTQGGGSVLTYTAADMLRFTVLQAGTNRRGGGISWAVSPYSGVGATSVFEPGVETGMTALAALIAPIRASIVGTTASTSYRTANTATLSTLTAGFVATRSADGNTEYIHVLTPPSAGASFSLPAPADKVVLYDAVNLATGRVVKTSPTVAGGYTLTLHTLDSWSATDTVIAFKRRAMFTDEIALPAETWYSRSGAAAVFASNALGSRYSGWTMSPTTTSQLETTFFVPSNWGSYDIDFYWGQAAAGSESAVLTYTHAQAVVGANMAVDDVSPTGASQAMVGVANVLQVVTPFQNVKNQPGALHHLRVARSVVGNTLSYTFTHAVLRRKS